MNSGKISAVSAFLKENTYTVPPLPEEFLEVNILENQNEVPLGNLGRVTPLSDSEIFYQTQILDGYKLTDGEDVKEVFMVELPSHGRHYLPGDTVGIIPYNSSGDLKMLFDQLKINTLIKEKCIISTKKETLKLNTKPIFINEVTTLYDVFRNHVDIRCLPKKTLIRLLAEYTTDELEREVLMKWCSKEGANRYEIDILGSNKSFLDIITSFKTCCPPVARLLENLPVLLPRPYSIASSYLATPDRIKLVFSVAKSWTGNTLQDGICTGMLKSMVVNLKNSNDQKKEIQMYYRKSHGFTLPDSVQPLILIGPGTGIAPFIGFLEHREQQKTEGKIWLFYGCRYKTRDFLFKKELEHYLECRVLTKLCASHSRESGETAKYVQDSIKKFGKEICDMIFDEEAVIYVCGDGRNMRKDVMNCFIEIIQCHKVLSLNEATAYMRRLQKDLRYRQDVWS